MIEEFTDGGLSAEEFSEKYVDTFLDEESEFSEETYQVLQTLFGEAEVYCPDPHLRDYRDVDEDELMEAAIEAAERLEQRMDEATG